MQVIKQRLESHIADIDQILKAISEIDHNENFKSILITGLIKAKQQYENILQYLR